MYLKKGTLYYSQQFKKIIQSFKYISQVCEQLIHTINNK